MESNGPVSPAPRAIQRPDGKVVAIDYFIDLETGPGRYIAATIWDPGFGN